MNPDGTLKSAKAIAAFFNKDKMICCTDAGKQIWTCLDHIPLCEADEADCMERIENTLARSTSSMLPDARRSTRI